MSFALRADGLSKQYRVDRPHFDSHHTLRDSLASAFSFRAKSTPRETIWALRDVSFDLVAGEALGVIGRNGAGKSTLLKLLSRITTPTEGRARIRGRVGSLLEVGSGFHPELTGRENIFLNGSILGMTRAEIRQRFDEIVAFAEVDHYIDTPVKRYSSGMYMRLAFAVAAHLEPEILIVDEVLAVGDTAFQKKCLGKMSHISREGRTVILVSHNLAAVQTLCSTALYLHQGRVAGYGEVFDQVKRYNEDSADTESDLPCSLGDQLSLEGLELRPATVESGERLEFSLSISSTSPCEISELSLLVYSDLGTRVAIVDMRQAEPFRLERPAQMLTIDGVIQRLPLVEGHYRLGLYIVSGELRRNFLDLAFMSVAQTRQPGGVIPYGSFHRGIVELDYSFDVRR